jgi:predicted AlkP superfamily phosphohydrolase/phosphomutase
VVIVSWDGGADWVIDRMLGEGKLPNLARLAKRGVAAEHSSPAFPSKTAVSHYAIFSGASTEISGVTGNSVPILPRRDHTILESRSGFDANSHLAEPIWVTAAKAGKRVLTLSAAGSYPAQPDQERLRRARVPLDRWVGFSGFESSISGDFVLDGRKFRIRPMSETVTDHIVDFSVGDTKFEAVAVDADPTANERFEKVVIRRVGEAEPEAVLTPSEARSDLKGWSRGFRVQKGDLVGWTYFRLFSLDPKTGEMRLLVRAANGMRGTESSKVNAEYLQAYGGFHGNPFGTYERGELGEPLYRGGDGTAERRVVEQVRLDCEFLKRSFRYGLKRWNPDLVTHYTPQSDGAGHTWMGVLDTESPLHDPVLAARILPYYEEVFRLQDDWLGDMMDAAGAGTAFALVSDHGMAGIAKYFNVNQVLERAGLLVRTADGKIDLTRTKVCAPPWGDFFVIANTTDWKGGIVPLAERDSVIRSAQKALLEAVDPATGGRIVTRVWRPEEFVGLGIGGPAGGDLYLDVATGYYPSNRLSSDVTSPGSAIIGNGVHGFYPQLRKMQAIFYLGGPGVAQNKRIPGVRVIDIAPTICRLMGIPLPADSNGIVVGQALDR